MKISVRHRICSYSLTLGFVLLAGCSIQPAVTTTRTAVSAHPVLGSAAMIGAAAIYFEDDLYFQTSDDALGNGKFQITVDKTRFAGGRSGELWQIFKRRAAYIVQREGCSSYTVLEYTEGNEAALVAGNRVGRGAIECIKPPAGKS
jgi:hypothetical protein